MGIEWPSAGRYSCRPNFGTRRISPKNWSMAAVLHQQRLYPDIQPREWLTLIIPPTGRKEKNPTVSPVQETQFRNYHYSYRIKQNHRLEFLNFIVLRRGLDFTRTKARFRRIKSFRRNCNQTHMLVI